eukprot:448319_1
MPVLFVDKEHGYKVANIVDTAIQTNTFNKLVVKCFNDKQHIKESNIVQLASDPKYNGEAKLCGACWVSNKLKSQTHEFALTKGALIGSSDNAFDLLRIYSKNWANRFTTSWVCNCLQLLITVSRVSESLVIVGCCYFEYVIGDIRIQCIECAEMYHGTCLINKFGYNQENICILKSQMQSGIYIWYCPSMRCQKLYDNKSKKPGNKRKHVWKNIVRPMTNNSDNNINKHDNNGSDVEMLEQNTNSNDTQKENIEHPRPMSRNRRRPLRRSCHRTS